MRPASSDSSCAACQRKGINCVVVERAKTRNRTGKNVEAAKGRYGSLTSSSSSNKSSSHSPSLVPAQELLAREELAGAFGNRLFELWLDQEHQRHDWPALELPVVDFWQLRERYDAW